MNFRGIFNFIGILLLLVLFFQRNVTCQHDECSRRACSVRNGTESILCCNNLNENMIIDVRDDRCVFSCNRTCVFHGSVWHLDFPQGLINLILYFQLSYLYLLHYLV